MNAHLQINREQLADFCRRNHIRRLSLFGSALRSDFRPDSDVDLLVEFEPEERVGYLRLATLQLDLTDLLGRTVDLRTPEELSRHFRAEVEESAELIYA